MTQGQSAPKKKKAKVKKPKKANRFNSKDNKHSPEAGGYLRTVLAPCAGNARIPDMNCTPTQLVTLTQEVSFTTSAGGEGGIIVSMPIAPTWSMEDPINTSSTAYVYQSAGAFTGLSFLTSNNSMARLVSACIDVLYTGSSMNNQGTIIGWQLGSSRGVQEATGPTSNNAARATRMNQTNRLQDGMTVFYRPMDASNFEFIKTSGYNETWGQLGVHVSGAAASLTLLAKITLNYEAVPGTDSASGSTTYAGGLKPSPVDPQGHAKAVNIAAQVRPFSNTVDAVKLTSNMAQVSNDLNTIWSVVRGFFTKAPTYGKLLA